MAAKTRIAVVGPGRLGTALTLELARAGYTISEIVAPNTNRSLEQTRRLASKVRAVVSTPATARLDAALCWFCVPDREIARAADNLSKRGTWKGKAAFHSSGALPSDELDMLRQRGAVVASVHPLMTFVWGAVPSLRNVPFAVEGDAVAVRIAKRIIRRLGGEAFPISRGSKVAYHTWGAFASPLLIAALVTAEHVARLAGLPTVQARKRMLPIVRQTIANYAALGPAAALSGPLVRGDAGIVRKHLEVLKKAPEARKVYVALTRSALRYLPAKNRRELKKALEK